MARRSKEADLIDLVVPLGGLILFLCLMSPQVRQIIIAIGFAAICFVGLAMMGLIGFAVYRFTIQLQRVEPVKHNVAWEPLDVEVITEERPPQNTPDFVKQLHSIDWFQFEQLVALVYRKLGHTVARHGGANPDGGIDIVIEKDGQLSAIQCKQWKTWNVGVKSIREFLGVMTDARIQRGILITLRGCTDEAKQLADKHGIEIVNEIELSKMLEDTDARFDPEALTILRDRRKICPKCEREMILRTATKGLRIGHQFWGCSAFPRCRFTMPVA